MSKTLRISLSITLFIVYLLGSIAILCYEYLYSDKTYLGYGLLVFAGSIVHILLYFLNQGYKNKRCSYFIVLGLIGVVIGILFFTTEISFNTLCILWGVLDIVRGLSEIVFTIPVIKNQKIEIYDIIISLSDIVLGILLCIKLGNGLHFHIVFMGISFILCALKFPLLLLIEKNKKI